MVNAISLPRKARKGASTPPAGAASPPAILRWTKPTLLVVMLLIERHLADPESESWGFDVAKATGLQAATAYPILRRLERAGWLLSRDEETNERAANGRATPPRTYFRINPPQLGVIRQELAEYEARQRSAGATLPGMSSRATATGAG
ncbi:hypothetical protein ABT272_36690 [Streptomyces sp900105245]|uniref:PadR family transcriptional regulator n=1 Tax=Streptomyces sp. 900105245 TaxID=3154379 RepID=A0ABV1UI36_9ACTN